jgi:hypothetical protein
LYLSRAVRASESESEGACAAGGRIVGAAGDDNTGIGSFRNGIGAVSRRRVEFLPEENPPVPAVSRGIGKFSNGAGRAGCVVDDIFWEEWP